MSGESYGPPQPPTPQGFAPQQGMPPGYQPYYRSAGADRVSSPAISLMIVTGLGMLTQVSTLMMNILGTSMSSRRVGGGPPQFEDLTSGIVGVVMNVLAIAVGAFIFWGLVSMKRLESRTLAQAAVIVGMIPCIGPCWCLGLPFGIWALTTLGDPAVKASFRS